MSGPPAPEFAVLVYREDGRWESGLLPPALSGDLERLVAALRQQPSDFGTLGFVAHGDDDFLLVRVDGAHTRFLLSDIEASDDWRLAAQVVDVLEIQEPGSADTDLPVGALDLLDDLGLDSMELGTLVGDYDMYADEVLATIADRLGFGEPFERALAAQS